MTRKILTSAMCLLLVASSVLTITGCANGNGSSSTTNPNSDISSPTGDTSATPNWGKEVNFSEYEDEAKEVVIVYCENGVDNFTARSIQVDDPGDNSVDKAVFNRNEKIKEWLGVTITPDKATDAIQDLEAVIGNDLGSGGDYYDVIAAYQYYGISMATKGYFLNYSNLQDDTGNPIDYIDLTKDYWAGNYIDSITYADCTYWITGALALRMIGGMYCTYVNSTIYNEVLEDEYGSIYKIAKDGNWTMDLLSEMAAKCYNDNGAVADEIDDADRLGYAWEANDPIDGLAFSCRVPFSTRNSDGSISVTINNQRSVSFVEALEKLLHSDFAYQCEDVDSTNVMPLFAQGNVAFHVNKLFMAENYLTNMTDDYYIIPAPKLNAQDAYVTGVHDGCTIYAINWASDAIAASAATLELMAYYSYTDVVPEYYDNALKYGYTRDSEAGEMIDIIYSSVNTDFVAAWSNSIENIVHFFRTHNTSKRIVTDLNRDIEKWSTALAKLISDLELYREG